ncbi:ATP/GTP-binding protein [Frigoribacterium sp. SL97]|uniref:ATP/GTP-binding protein n=1 Tax=Frigoribacterium sp. SL97 TaxID=2994664 RepID=UPI00226EF086|nr:ATP/GTP-binding protein [Frigoribacterium sp. SL97]WAC53126.1 ATP/GTP-binding protein [Frigoribacterium sp. SL97]
MGIKRGLLEQHIAVFGESGSGKTVLLSSFYGGAQEPAFREESIFGIVADDSGQGTRLHQNYLGMRDAGRRPSTTRFSSTSYTFSFRRRDRMAAEMKKRKPSGDLRLVWHDYPGDWFIEEPSSAQEAERRVQTFRALLSSNVALLLVDGQRLAENSGEEERYLKVLFSNVRNGIHRLEAELLRGRKPFAQFPRIWIIALSKADLLPDLDVVAFRDLVIGKAGGELSDLRGALQGLIQSPEALSVGEDFVLLSSAKFEPDGIHFAKRVGLDLILPIAAVLPFIRNERWARGLEKGGEAASIFSRRAKEFAAFIGNKSNFRGPIGQVLNVFAEPAAEIAAKLATDKLADLNHAAIARHDFMAAVLTGFKMDLDRGEHDRVLIQSLR